MASQDLFVRQARLAPGTDTDAGYPFSLPVVRALDVAGGIAFDAPVTFLTGDNGTGKSTLVEALAVAAGFNPEGGSQSFRFATRSSESSLGDALVLRRGIRKPRTGFFLRAESYYNVASELERLDHEPDAGPRLMRAYGGVSPHERSHGQSFLDLITHRFRPNGLYLLDEPEAALSPRGAMAALARITELAEHGSQFVIATHSPILLAAPGARILHITDQSGHIAAVTYDDAEPVALTRAFLADPGRFLRHLTTD